MWQHFKVLLWKNLIIRKRHWLLTTTEVLIPIILFTVMAYGRSKIDGLNKVHIDEPTYHEISNLHDIYSHLDVGGLQLWYAPDTDFYRKIIQKVQEKFQIPGDAVKNFPSRNDLLTEFGRNTSSLIAAAIFNGNDVRHLNYDLTIFDTYFTWDTDKLFVPMITIEGESTSKYMYKGFAALQAAINLAYMELLSPNITNKEIKFSLQAFPDPPRTVDSGLNQLFIYFLPLITIFSFIFLCPAVLRRVGEEKVSGTKEFMKMVGLRSSLIWLGWFIHALITNLFSIIVIVILMKVPFWGVSYPPVEHSDGTVLFMFLFLYCMAAITFCFLIGSIFNTPSIATIFGILVWILSYFIPQAYINLSENLPWKCKLPFTLLPNMALSFGYFSISIYEMRETGIQWSNLFEPGSGDDNDITMGNVFVMLIVDIIVFMLLTLYIENVKPGEYGISKPYHFPATDLIKFVKRCFSHRIENSTGDNLLPSHDVEEGIPPCIQIRNLYKKYSNHMAVDNLNMDIYKNHITVLLGQNGAGKTTTMSILTGMINATNGFVAVNGKDIQKYTDEVRKLMGLCPQHNLFFPDLTVSEHLEFFAMLKGSKELKKETEEMLEILGIGDKKNDMANTLSGGMKRKLCLGMALIGHSEVIILDEPTSGMDPESRRKVWDLLLEYRKTKTILITTHFMEEADVLGDWIAIMANGHLQCYGTPMQLKTKYNTGYHLCLLLKSQLSVYNIKKKVTDHFANATIIRETDDSIVFLLPLDEEGKYASLIQELEQKENNWDIVSINMNVTTLNDVFLKAKDEMDAVSETQVDSARSEDFIELHHSLTKGKRICNNLFALMIKRWYFLQKKFYYYIPAIVVSNLIFFLAIWSALSENNFDETAGPPLNLSLEVYGKTKVFYGGTQTLDPVITKMRGLYEKEVVTEDGHPELMEDISSGIIADGVSNIAFYKRHIIASAEFNTTQNPNEIIVNSMYSSEALHGIPISLNLAMNAIVKTLFNETFSITTKNVPLKPISSDSAPTELSPVNVTSVFLILIPISLFFFMSIFIVFPHTEVSTDFIQIQTIAGIKTHFYWLSNVLFDLMFSIIPLMVQFLLLCLFNTLHYNSNAFQDADIGALVVIFITYIVTSLPFTYLLSYRKTISGGFNLLVMLGIFVGILPTLIIFAMEFSGTGPYTTIARCLKPILILLFPQFALSYICVKFSKKYVDIFNWRVMDPYKKKHLCSVQPNPCCYTNGSECDHYQSYFQSKNFGIQNELLLMILTFFIYFAILMFLNSVTFKRISHILKYPRTIFTKTDPNSKTESHNSQLREDVDEVDKGTNENKTLLVKDLTKSFGTKQIVKKLKFHLNKNKCFGLLGVNGAGKSTTFRMLTKYLFFDKGDIVLESERTPVKISQPEYCEKIGYCPQEDCLNFFLSGRELLTVMACLKGYPRPDAEKATNYLLREFGLEEYADKPCSEYSGGNKRKLSTCLAFLGSPKVILLDEPTSGVDPASRRKFWNILSSFKKAKDTSFLLCSHSMEECENLCDEIAIMKNGEIKDQGSLLVLKNKYQKGFKVTVRLRGTDKMEQIKSDIAKELCADLKEEYGGTLTYQVEDNDKRLSSLFFALEHLKDKYNVEIESYVVNQISLEDIFLTVAESN